MSLNLLASLAKSFGLSHNLSSPMRLRTSAREAKFCLYDLHYRDRRKLDQDETKGCKDS